MQNKIYEILEDEAAKIGLQGIPQVENKIETAAKVYENDPEVFESLLHRFRKIRQIHSKPFTLPPNGKLPGPIRIGTNIRGGPVGITKEETAHTLLVGRTGVGKSTSFGRIISEVDKNCEDVAIIAIDPKKSLRGLIHRVPNLYPVRLDEIKFNPLSMSFKDANTQKQWISTCWGIIARESDLLTGSRSFGLQIFKELLEDFESKNYPPAMSDLLDKGKEKVISVSHSSPVYNYAERFISRIEGMLFSLEETFDCKRGFPIGELLNPERHILIETDGVSDDHSLIFCLLLLNSIFHYNLTHGKRGSGVKLMVFIDEAENFIGYDSKYDKSKKGTSFSSLLLERGRELGFSILMGVHHTKLSSTAFENLNSRICMDLSSSDDVAKVASDMGLNEDQAESLEELDVGEAVMKVKGKWDEPFLVKVDPVELSNVSDREVKEHSKNFLKEMEEYVVPREKKTSEKKSKKEKSEEEITKQEHLLLENIARFPYLSISERKEKLGWSNSRLSNMRKKLRSKGYTRNKRLKKPEGGRGSTLKLLEATGKALKYLKEQGIKTKYIGRGNAVHSYYMQWFLDNLKRKSVDVSYETDIGGIAVDLFIVKQSGKTQAIEIEVSSSENTLNKLKKLLEMVDRVLIVSDKKVLVDEFKTEVEKMDIDQDRVSIKKIQDIEF